MVDGGDNIVEATWESVSSMLQVVSEAGHTLTEGFKPATVSSETRPLAQMCFSAVIVILFFSTMKCDTSERTLCCYRELQLGGP